MNTFELRWLERKTGITFMNSLGYYQEETTKTLQYRYKEKVTDYSSNDPATKYYRTVDVWSEWIDVPTYVEGVKL